MSSETQDVIFAALRAAVAESRREIDQHVEYERERFEQTVAALAAASPVIADIKALTAKPTYTQVGTLELDGYNRCELPFDTLQVNCMMVRLIRGYESAIQHLAAALSAHKDGPLPTGKYRYAIMLFREDEPKQGG